MKKIAIIGASGHGKVIADIAQLCGYEEIVFLDDDESVTECGKYPVVGKSKDIYSMVCDAFVAIGNAKTRERIQEQIEKEGKNTIPTLIHPNAVVADSVTIGKGSVVMAGAVINPDAKIGQGVIINTCSSVDHDCMVGDYVHVAVGAHIAGNVIIEEETWIGAGATVIQGIRIEKGTTIGAGAVVIRDIPMECVAIGVPATPTIVKSSL